MSKPTETRYGLVKSGKGDYYYIVTHGPHGTTAIYDHHKDGWQTKHHPLAIIKNAFIVTPLYYWWCAEQYFKTGIIHLRNSTQIVILERGNFRIIDLENNNEPNP